MARKKLEETPLETVEPISEPVSEPTLVVESEAKRSFREHIEKYKTSNPKKYALKEKELLAKLDQIP